MSQNIKSKHNTSVSLAEWQVLNSWRSAELSVDSRFHAGLVTATGPYTDPTAHSGWLPTVWVYVCRLYMLKKNIIWSSTPTHFNWIVVRISAEVLVWVCVSVNITILPPPCWNDCMTVWKINADRGGMTWAVSAPPGPSFLPRPGRVKELHLNSGPIVWGPWNSPTLLYIRMWPASQHFTHSGGIPYLLLLLDENILKKSTPFIQMNRRVDVCRKGHSV